MVKQVTSTEIIEILKKTSRDYLATSEGLEHSKKLAENREKNFYNVKKTRYLASEKTIVYEHKKKTEFSFRQVQCAWLVKFLLKIRDPDLRQTIIDSSDFSETTKDDLQELYGTGMTATDWDDYQATLLSDKEKAKLRKSQKRLTDLCLANKFDLFFTLTFNPKIVDSFDYDSVKKALMRFLESMRKKYGKFDYIFVMELHESGRAHCHGLTYKLDLSFTPKLNNKGEAIIANGHEVFDCTEWSSKYGYGEYSKIENLESASRYISKYITKDMFQLAPGKNRYLCSQGLNRPVTEYSEVDLTTFSDSTPPVMVVQDWDDQKRQAYDKIKIYVKKHDLETGEILESEESTQTKYVGTSVIKSLIQQTINNQDKIKQTPTNKPKVDDQQHVKSMKKRLSPASTATGQPLPSVDQKSTL